MTHTDVLAAAYDAGVDEEFNRLVSTPAFKAEYHLVTQLIQKYIAPQSTVFDIGAGPGRYTEFLLALGCKVGAIDISPKSLLALSTRINGCYGENLMFTKVGCATKSHNIELNSADAVLIMGPMYHLVQKQERMLALQQANRILKPGGSIFSIFMSTFPEIKNCNKQSFNNALSECVTPVEFQGFCIEQFRCCPHYAEMEMNEAGFGIIHRENLDSEFTSNNQLGIASQYILVGRKL